MRVSVIALLGIGVAVLVRVGVVPAGLPIEVRVVAVAVAVDTLDRRLQPVAVVVGIERVDAAASLLIGAGATGPLFRSLDHGERRRRGSRGV